MDYVKRHTKRMLIGVIGSIIVLIGIVLIPYPGPGWLIVFSGLAVLATEFDGARQLLERARRYYDEWTAWLRRQSRFVQVLFLAGTGLVIVMTVWLCNGFGMINVILHLQQEWLISPLFR